MKVSVKGIGLAAGILWGGCLLCLGLLHLAFPSYAADFLRGISSVYPWFHGARSLGDAVVGGIDGFVDGAIAGLLFGWLYNLWAGRPVQG